MRVAECVMLKHGRTAHAQAMATPISPNIVEIAKQFVKAKVLEVSTVNGDLLGTIRLHDESSVQGDRYFMTDETRTR